MGAKPGPITEKVAAPEGSKRPLNGYRCELSRTLPVKEPEPVTRRLIAQLKSAVPEFVSSRRPSRPKPCAGNGFGRKRAVTTVRLELNKIRRSGLWVSGTPSQPAKICP